MDVGELIMQCVLICNAEDRTQANLLAQTFGYGPDNFSVPLSTNGSEPITHYGGFASGGVSPTFVQLISDAGQGVLPDAEWPDELPAATVLPLLAKLTVRFNEDWQTTLTDLGLTTVLTEQA
jgi:hypothetical protein